MINLTAIEHRIIYLSGFFIIFLIRRFQVSINYLNVSKFCTYPYNCLRDYFSKFIFHLTTMYDIILDSSCNDLKRRINPKMLFATSGIFNNFKLIPSRRRYGLLRVKSWERMTINRSWQLIFYRVFEHHSWQQIKYPGDISSCETLSIEHMVLSEVEIPCQYLKHCKIHSKNTKRDA